MTPSGDAARLRLGALAFVAALVLAVRTLAPDPGMRRASLLLVALGRASTRSRRLPPLARSPWPHVATVTASAAVVGLAVLAPGSAARGVDLGVPAWLAVWTPEEVIAVLLLYHSVTWLGRALAPSRGARSSILLMHALPLLVLAGADALAPAAFAWVASPPAYLFLSAAHAVHTCCERGFEAA